MQCRSARSARRDLRHAPRGTCLEASYVYSESLKKALEAFVTVLHVADRGDLSAKHAALLTLPTLPGPAHVAANI